MTDIVRAFDITKIMAGVHVKMMMQSKPMCGLFHANVAVSEHNDNGTCPCLKCFGTHCHGCSTFEKLAAERAELDLVQKSRCQLCQAYEYKTR